MNLKNIDYVDKNEWVICSAQKNTVIIVNDLNFNYMLDEFSPIKSEKALVLLVKKTTLLLQIKAFYKHISLEMAFFKPTHTRSSSNDSNGSENTPFFRPQAKLSVGESNDKYEQEADAVANKVVNKGDIFGNTTPFFLPQPKLQRSEESNPNVQRSEDGEQIQGKSIASTITPLVQKKEECDDCAQAKVEEDDNKQLMEGAGAENSEEEALSQNIQKMEEEDVQTKPLQQATSETNTSSFESRLNSKKGTGSQMDSSTKSRMEGAFGTKFDNVNIHADSDAASMSSEINAQAFAHGKDVFFNEGKYNPGTQEGDMLLAHELTHTIQQEGAESEANGNEQSLEKDAEKANVGLARKLMMGAKGLGKGVLPRLKSGLRISKCSKEEKSHLDVIKEGPSNTDARTLYTNYSPIHLKQQLARINVLVDVSTASIKKKNPADGKMTDVFALVVHNTSFTNPATAGEINKLFPAGQDAYMIRSTHASTKAKLDGVVGGYSKANPNNFSEMQVSNLLNSGGDANACIGTMNTGIQNLYGNKTIEKGDMDDTAFGSIDKLKAKGMAREPLSIPANYSGTEIPIDYDNPAKLAKVTMPSPSAAMQKQLSTLPDGPYVYAFSVANGYHSVTLIVHKSGTAFEFMWKDQGGIKKMTASELDAKILRYMGASSHNDFKAQYNRKNKTTYEHSEDIPKGPKYDLAARETLPTTVQNIKKNLFALLKPV